MWIQDVLVKERQVVIDQHPVSEDQRYWQYAIIAVLNSQDDAVVTGGMGIAELQQSEVLTLVIPEAVSLIADVEFSSSDSRFHGLQQQMM